MGTNRKLPFLSPLQNPIETRPRCTDIYAPDSHNISKLVVTVNVMNITVKISTLYSARWPT